MYKLSLPLMNHTVDCETRKIYAEQFRAAEIERVFLALDRVFERKEIDEAMLSLGENIAYFQKEGFEVGVWINALGHGVGESGADGYDFMVDQEGNVQEGVCCPFGDKLNDTFAYLTRSIAALHPDAIMVDDDFRMSLRGPHFACFCPKHMARLQEICDEEFTREFFVEQAFSDKPNKYRTAYLQAQKDGLWQLARTIRAAVDSVDRRIPIILCCCVTAFDVDGLDMVELAKYWAGEGAAEIRTPGAPYWACVNTTALPGVIETSRMISHVMRDSGVRLMSEGDAYPRPRYNIPASYLELCDAALRADGTYDGILKYMVDYLSDPAYETGYLQLHGADLPALKAVGDMFAEGTACGVQVVVNPTVFATADFSVLPPNYNSPWAFSATMLARCSVPTVYNTDSPVKVVFGEDARHFTPADDDCVILDGAAALILQEKGVDVGIRRVRAWNRVSPVREVMTQSGRKVAARSVIASDNTCLLLQADYADTVAVQSEFVINHTEVISIEPNISADKQQIPAAYRYQNEKGQKFLVFPFSVTDSKSVLYKHYVRQQILLETIEQFFGFHLPVKCEKHPDLYLLAKRTAKGLAVFVGNCFADPIVEPVFTLDKAYTAARFINTDGVVDGHVVRLKSAIPAFSFAAFTVENA